MIKKDRLQKRFVELCTIDAVHTEEDKVIEYLDSFFAQHDVTGQRDEHRNVLYKVPGTGEPIFLNAHTDTVESTKGLEVVEEGNKLTTNGKTILGGDDRAGIAAILEGVEHILEDDIPHRPMEILFTAGEEVGLLGAQAFDYNKLTAKEGITFDTDGPVSTVITASVGFVHFNGEIKGKAAHAAMPEQGIHALKAAAEFIHTMPFGKCTEETYINVGSLTSGKVSNAVPDTAHLICEIRSRNQQELEAHVKSVQERLREVHNKYGTSDTFSFDQSVYPFHLDEGHPFLQKVMQGIKAIGLTPKPEKSMGGMDANIFNANGITTIVVGTGYYNMHSKQEYENMDELYDVVRFFEYIIKS